jgi:3-oxoacyl-[acyl-carrier-protein] synthase III
MNCKIIKTEYYLPETILDNSELEKIFPAFSADKIEQKTGIRQRHIAKGNETSLDLAFKACEKIFENYEKSKIDFLLFCTQSPDYYLPTTACILHDKLGLRENVGALDFNLGCSGFIYGIYIAKGLISSGLAKSVLLITAETYSKFIHPQDKSNLTIFGDAASATIIEISDELGIFEFDLGTDGSGYNNLIVPNGGMRNKFNYDAPEIIDSSSNVRTDNNLFMNGPEIFNFTIRKVPTLVKNILEKNKISIDNIDYIIFHQANKYMLDHLRDKLCFPDFKFHNDILLSGNTVSATIPIALKNAMDEGKIKIGDKVLLAGFGVGYSWGGTIIAI